ncbi:endonuclease/Exonuclease/phosphatase [Thelonectria olida]|uniref:Endonuclease/Exonuclease/phosphatase n=1 Tax=Thelonectria olida TaxID=1576542 RepID=A0A9P9AEE9_9HYPO|nr:endonuclease/Exonuclease/phosphatase [Thelonectria olida]
MVRANLICSSLLLAGLTAASETGDLTILSMNVAGLPAILQSNDVPGDKTTNSRLIGTYFAKYGYDVIHVQEDFNYHAYIYETDTHAYRTATSGGAAIGSGLNALANFDWVGFTRVKWNDCSSASGADCLTPKGFTFMRLQVAEGVYIDAYNLHTDAGTEDDDEKARNSNLKQVADYIDTWSEGNAVLVFGDTNSRYTRTADNIRIFGTQNGLTDPWVELVRDGVEPTVESLCANPSTTNSCETVDKVFYRGSSIIDLSATSFNYESKKFLQADGNVLSDHNPVGVNFTWSLSSSLRQSNLFGGPHGEWFTDLPSLATLLSSSSSVPKPAKLSFSGASRLDSVSITLKDGTKFTHGGDGGTAANLELGTSEYWTDATVCWGKKSGQTRIFYIKAQTSKGNTVNAGTTTDDCSSIKAPTSWQIVGFLGQDGDEVDQLGFIFSPQ